MSRMPRIVLRMLVGVALVGLGACSQSDAGFGILVAAPDGGMVATVAVSPSSATLAVGGTLQVTATLLGGNDEVLSGDLCPGQVPIAAWLL